MSRMQRFDWFSDQRGFRSQSSPRYDRRLRIEPLEDRRMLATFAVANLNDSGPGSLRAAITLANNAAGHDTILFNAALSGQTITLGGSDIDITESLTIDATALVENITVDADGQSRIFDITAPSGTSTLAGLTLTGGLVTGNQNGGGAVRSVTTGSLTLTIDRSTITGNSTSGFQSYGGGLDVNGGFTISNSTVSENRTYGSQSFGGGIQAYGDVTVTNSTVSGNQAQGNVGYGGGIFTRNDVTITDSTVSENVGAKGGGIFAFGAVTLTQSTVSGNSTPGTSGSDGGGIWNDDDPIIIIGSIVTGNTDDGGNPDLYLGSGTVSVTYSLIGDTTGTSITAGSSNVVNQPALLGPLAINGGFTETHSLLANSPALDAGNPAIVFNPADFDQRGDPFIRVSDGNLVPGARIDMGAFEDQPIPAAFFVVDTLVDELDGSVVDGDTSLRDAIAAASEGQTISFSVSGVINLTLGQLGVTKGMTIIGPGSSQLTIDAGGNSRIFDVVSNLGNDNVMISGLTLTGGSVTGSGGAIRSRENFTLSDAVVTGNMATDNGGGIDAVSSSNIFGSFTTTIIDSVVSDNGTTSSGGKGGGIFVSTVVGSSTTITGSTISGNTTAGSNGEGGGLYSINSGTMTISGTTVSGNSTNNFSSAGGGMYLETLSAGTTNISESTIANNLAGMTVFDTGKGGGLAVSNAGITNITSSTISGNFSKGDGGGVSVFGGAGDTIIAHSTITLNTSDPNGGGIRGGGIAQSGSGTVTLDHTIVAGNSDDIGSGPDVAGSVNATYSLIGDGASATITDNGGTQIGLSAGDLNVSIDMAAMGDFESGGIGTDSYVFEYSLNGGSFLPLFTSSVDEAGSLLYTFEDGSTQTDDDPLQVNGMTLSNQFQTLTAVVPGSAAGDSLELRLTAMSDGAFDVFAFRNITVQLATGNVVIGRALGPAPDLNVAFVQDDLDYTISGDMFGVRSRTSPGTPGLPDDIVDDTVASPPDTQGGIIRSTDTADFFGIVDTVNGTGNDVNVARWTFEIDVIDPLLGPLQDNGGPTETHALLVGSPAIDTGDPSAAAGVGDVPLYDQRGTSFDRVVDNSGGGARIDIGAYEVQTAPSADFDSNSVIDGFDFLAWQLGFGTVAPNAEKTDGDADDDLDVDGDDLDVWELQYGTAAPLVAAAPALAAQATETIASEPLSQPTLSHSELVDVALAVSQRKPSDGDSDPQVAAVDKLPLAYFAEPHRPSGNARPYAALLDKPAVAPGSTTNSPRDDAEQSSEEASAWEDVVDELFASAFE